MYSLRQSRPWKAYRQFHKWLRRVQITVRLQKFPGQRQLDTVTGPIELVNDLVLGDRTVYSVSVPSKIGRARIWKVILLGPDDKVADVPGETVTVIRILEGRLWPQFVKTVPANQLQAEGYGVNVSLEAGETLLDVVLSW